MPRHTYTRKDEGFQFIAKDGKKFNTEAKLLNYEQKINNPQSSAVNVNKEDDFLLSTRQTRTKDVLVANKNKYREQEKVKHVSKFYYRIKGSVGPPASSHGAGVATGVAVNVDDKVLPANKEEFREQETEEDDFCLSTKQTRNHLNEFVAPDGKTFKSFFGLQHHKQKIGRMSKIPASSHVATGSAVNVNTNEEESHERETEEDDFLFSTTQTSDKRRQKMKDPQVVNMRRTDGKSRYDGKFVCNVCGQYQNFCTLEILQQHVRQKHANKVLPVARWMPKLPASSYDAGVATSSAVNVDRVLPVAKNEESRKKGISKQGRQKLTYSQVAAMPCTDKKINERQSTDMDDTMFPPTVRVLELGNWHASLAAGINVGKILAGSNKEESHEQETEDDSLSDTSTIDYDFEYTDEKYSSTSDDEDGSTDEELSKRMPELEREWRAIHLQTRHKWPDKDAWVATWKEVYELRRWTWISVYAYFQKGQGYGGYGVILRNAVAKPIIASAKFSKDGKSFFYQVFMGIKAGVKLAEEQKRCLLSVDCNSVMVPLLFRDIRCCSDKKCRDTRYPNHICEGCESYFKGYRGWIKSLMAPLVVELRGKKNLLQLTSSWSKAAHYLAKREKKKKKKEERSAPDDDDKPGDMELDDFPPELKDILWIEAFATSNFMADYDEDLYSSFVD